MIRAILLALAALAAPAAAAVDAERLDATLAAVPGFAGVVLVGEGDRIAYEKAVGEAAPGQPHRADERWRLASVTKQLTALLVMQEVAAGRLDLDGTIADSWPDWPNPDRDKITIRMLLRHESGLADPNATKEDAAGIPAYYRDPANARPNEAAAGFCARTPRAKPGEGFHYNNCDFLILGTILERTTGKPFATLVAERIATPLDAGIGMFGAGPPGDVPGFDASGAREPAIDLSRYGAAGGAYGTAADLWKLDLALMDNRLLDRIATDAMWAGEPSLGYAALGAWSFPAPLRGCPDPVPVIERRGAIGGIQVRNFLLPKKRLAMIVFTNRTAVDFGEVWQQTGLAHDLLAAAACPR